MASSASDSGNIVISESWFGEIISMIVAAVKPVLHFIAAVAGSGETGFAIIFVIFFMIYLVRVGARTGNSGVYANGLRYIGFHGVLVCAAYLIVLSFEFFFTPFMVLAWLAISNSVSGDEPGIRALYDFFTGSSPYKASFGRDLKVFYKSDRLMLPLGFRPAILVTLAFACMYIVARALGGRQTAKSE